tara:strand:+ start:38 stop:478 length:441 start_codon:yes stop_codon:yes gene_type:complete
MKNIKSIFSNLERKLAQASWFKEGWEIYNRGPYLQLYKSNWFNLNQSGVHFETYIEDPQIKKKCFPICMHAENDCPFQQDFIKKFLELEKGRISSWKGYKISGEGYSICMKEFPLNFKNLEDRMYQEFNKLRKLESTVDQLLDQLK